MRWVWHVAFMEHMRNEHGVLLGRFENTPFCRFGYLWRDTFNVYSIAWTGVDWINLAENMDQGPALLESMGFCTKVYPKYSGLTL
jgi:hypothetical protein